MGYTVETCGLVSQAPPTPLPLPTSSDNIRIGLQRKNYIGL